MAETYQKTIKGTLGAGMSSLIGSTSNYYILEHKVTSKYHKMGEAQEIIVDYAEIGRDWDCAIRFDESFNTVSRKHAAIIKKDGNWKLVQLSQTNSTFLNGHKVENEWYLQNGDEIQLSINGPKLGFIIPEANTGKTSMNLTHRLSLFGKQALRPYRNAVIILGIVLLLVVGGGVGYGIYAKKQADAVAADAAVKQAELEQQLLDTQTQLLEQTEQLIMLTQQLDSTQQEAMEARIKALKAEAQSAKDQKALKQVSESLRDLQDQVQQMKDAKEQVEEQDNEQKVKEAMDYINSYGQ